ncbi:transcobalamin-1-like [Mytilus trossulus]|uniref:transcobalamin-1-like n=1 Tax=Mytilus trossulus TaxID=6551 RepID=UPI00300457BB
MGDPRNIDVVLTSQTGHQYDSKQKKNYSDNYKELSAIKFSENKSYKKSFAQYLKTQFRDVRNKWLLCFICAVLTGVAVFLVMKYGLGSSSQDLNPYEPGKEHEYEDGSRQLLLKRNDEWSWGTRTEAEAVIALHLYQFTTFSKDNPDIFISVKQMNIDLLSALSNDISLSREDWGHGKLAHYILGILATCQDPSQFYGHNLIDKMKNHLVVSSTYLMSNKFAYSLIVIALCKAGEYVDVKHLDDISSTPGQYKFGVDEASIVYIAYKCVGDETYKTKKDSALDYILQHQEQNGLFGNEFSTSLAIQAIFASGDNALVPKTEKGIAYLKKSIDRSNMPSTALLVSALPAIAMKSYLDIGTHECLSKYSIPSKSSFPIGISVLNNITYNDYERTWSAPQIEGQTLFDAMLNLKEADSVFSFDSKSTKYGPYITSICNMAASTDQRQYWKIEDADGDALQYGANQTFPKRGNSYTFKLTTW